MAKAIWRRSGNTAIPVGDESLEALHAHKDGAEFIAITKGARNLKQLRMFWALATIVAENDAKIETKEVAKKNMLIALNHVDVWFDRDGGMHIDPQSIAFESMTQEVFNPFFKRAIDLVCRWLGTAPADIQKRVAEIIAEKRYDNVIR